MKKKNQKNTSTQNLQKKGFTLIEILVVSTIIIVVSAIGLVSYSGAQVSARDAQRKSDLDTVRTTLLLYRTENGYYPVAGLDPDLRVAFSLPRQMIARIGSIFRASTVQAANEITDDEFSDESQSENKEGDTFDDSSDTGTLPTETPPVTPGINITPSTSTPAPPSDDDGLPTPTPSIEPSDGTQQAVAVAYQELSDLLLEEGYLEEELPLDPVNDSTYYYGYDSDGSGFELTARLEKDGSVVTLTD